MKVLRIIDANANRAREALRVMEEAARFLLDDAPLTESLKHLRHDLAAQLALIEGLEAARDTPGDVGTAVTTDAEASRACSAEVVVAAGKRLSESLRAMEEYGKIVNRSFAAGVEQLRYRGYDIEQRLNRVMTAGRARQWCLCALITEALCRDGDWFAVARAVVQAGGDCIQLREKSLDASELLGRARKLVKLCHDHGTSLIVNDRPDVALLADADGVHLGQTDLPCAEVRKMVGTRLLIGVSTSSMDQAVKARADGADYCGVGPMFPTTTKHKPVIAGPDYLRAFTAWNQLPHLAIGGINAENIRTLAGVRGIAVSSAICAADDPGGVTRTLLNAVADRSF